MTECTVTGCFEPAVANLYNSRETTVRKFYPYCEDHFLVHARGAHERWPGAAPCVIESDSDLGRALIAQAALIAMGDE